MTRHLAAAALIAALPVTAWSVGSDDSSPPEPTPTSTTCDEGLVWDADAEKCVAPKDSRLDQDELYQAARELAYAGRYDGASRALDAMADQGSDRVLTYRGFIARKSGDRETALAWYRRALDVNPDNVLARSYMGQGFVEDGRIDLARSQLAEIRLRGGSGTWAEAALKQAIVTGQTYSF